MSKWIQIADKDAVRPPNTKKHKTEIMLMGDLYRKPVVQRAMDFLYDKKQNQEIQYWIRKLQIQNFVIPPAKVLDFKFRR